MNFKDLHKLQPKELRKIKDESSWKIKTTDEYKNACDIYPELPKNPNEFYSGFSNLFYELKN